MNKEVYEWFNDGHKILVVLDGDKAFCRVICPGIESGQKQPGLKCGMGDTEQPYDFCWVREMVSEYGLECHCTGLAIGVRSEMQIEWGYFGDGDEFWFKCAGYPSDMEVKEFRKEAFSDLFPETPESVALKAAKAVGLQTFKPWSHVIPETKEQYREDIDRYFEDQERKNAGQGQ